MKRVSVSLKVYGILVIILAAASWGYVFAAFDDTGAMAMGQDLPVSRTVMAWANAAIMIVVYGGLGFIGLLLARKTGFPEIWDEKATNRQRFLLPALIGISTGIFFILADLGLGVVSDVGRLPHPPFPGSILASVTAGIGEEIIFRLFFISLWMWIFHRLIFRGRYGKPVFWIVAVFSALAFAAGHIPSAMYMYGWTSLSEIPGILLAGIFVLNGAVSIAAAYGFRKFGFLAAAGIHFWTDIVWHVIWGAI